MQFTSVRSICRILSARFLTGGASLRFLCGMVLLLFRIPASASAAGDEKESGQRMCVAFWNLENFFDTSDDPEKEDEEFLPMGRRNWSRKRFSEKAANLSKVIFSTADRFGSLPVLLGAAEVENAYVLDYLLRSTPLAETDYSFIHYDSPDLRGIDVALLYRKSLFRPLSSRPVAVDLGTDSRPTRDILYVKGVLGGLDTVHIFVNHWPSKLGGERKTSWKRERAAALLQFYADSLAGGNVIFMGDFNDTPESESVSLLTGNMKLLYPDAVSDSPLISSVYVPDDSAPDGFRRRAADMSFSEMPVGTNRYRENWSVIDLMLVSPALTEKDNLLYAPQETYHIYAPVFLLHPDEKYSGCRPFRTFNGPRYLGGFSDHLPVVLELVQLR